MTRMGVSKALEFAALAAEHQGPGCLTWPFSCNNRGYPQVAVRRVMVLATRVVCEMRRGPPPTPTHHAAHSCGNGHLGCVSGAHLRWSTKEENYEDRKRHGRMARGTRCHANKLTEAQVLDIFQRAHGGELQDVIASEFGVDQTAVSKIKTGRAWGWLTMHGGREWLARKATTT